MPGKSRIDHSEDAIVARDGSQHPSVDGHSTSDGRPLPVRLAGGAVCCTSGGALVLHVLTGSPLWLGLATVGFATSVLLAVAIVAGGIDVRASPELRRLLGRASIVGLVATTAYDVARWILVQLGGMQVSPFEALPLFGQALLGSDSDGLAVQTAGIAYHLLNGVAFAMAYVIWLGHRHWRIESARLSDCSKQSLNLADLGKAANAT